MVAPRRRWFPTFAALLAAGAWMAAGGPGVRAEEAAPGPAQDYVLPEARAGLRLTAAPGDRPIEEAVARISLTDEQLAGMLELAAAHRARVEALRVDPSRGRTAKRAELARIQEETVAAAEGVLGGEAARRFRGFVEDGRARERRTVHDATALPGPRSRR